MRNYINKGGVINLTFIIQQIKKIQQMKDFKITFVSSFFNSFNLSIIVNSKYCSYYNFNLLFSLICIYLIKSEVPMQEIFSL